MKWREDYRKGEITMIDAKQSFLSQVRKRAAEDLVAMVEDALEE